MNIGVHARGRKAEGRDAGALLDERSHGFEIEAETRDAVLKCAPLAAALSVERVAQEIEKTLLTDHPEYVAEMISSGLLKHWISGPAQDDPMKLKRIVPDRVRRWCGLGLLCNHAGLPELLHLDREVIHAFDACYELHKQADRDALFWKRAIHQYGKKRSAIAADVLSAWDSSNDAETLLTIISSGDCCTISELAVRGDDLKELGLRGKMIGEALENQLPPIRCSRQIQAVILLAARAFATPSRRETR